MSTRSISRRWRPIVALVAGLAIVLSGLVGAVTSAHPAAGDVTTNDDALQARVRSELGVFTNWLATNHVKGYIGEVGWPNNSDTTQWNALAQKWYADAAAAGLMVTQWSAGEWWYHYKLSTYVSADPTQPGPVSIAQSPAAVIESQANPDVRGIADSGGEFGGPLSIAPTSTYSNANPGANEHQYHFDTQGTFDYLASRGITLVRIPIMWERLQPTLGGPLDPNYLQLVTDAVNRVQAAGMRAFIEPMNFAAYWLYDGTQGVRQSIGSPAVPISYFADFWQKVSAAFKNNSGLTGYELMNEPTDMSGSNPAHLWEQASQSALSAIRNNGDNKLVLVPGYNWSGAQSWAYTHPTSWIVDPANNFRYEAHHYWDRDNSGSFQYTYAQEVQDAQSRGYTASATTTSTTAAPTTTTTVPQTTTTTAPSASPSTPTDTDPPTAPGSPTATSLRGRISVRWQASTDTGGSGIGGYSIYRATSDTGPFTLVDSVGRSARSWTDRCGAGVGYSYYVVAFDKAGNVSPPSATVSAVAH